MLGDNYNGKVVSHLAKRSLACSRTRNFFILITIVLSVSLLSGITLFYSGMTIKERRQLDQMQHVLYENLSQEQIEKLQREEQIDEMILFKSGQGMEVERYVLVPYYYEQKQSQIQTIEITEGKYPEKWDEIAVDKAYMKQIGRKAVSGETVTIPFLDGTEETFTISGFTDTKSSAKVYTLMFSKEYAENGAQLKNVAYTAAVRIRGAKKMSDDEFLLCIREIGSKCGIERVNINENNYFLDSLSMSNTEIMTIIGVGIGILFVSVLVIYSVFYLSIAGRIQQFGQLRTLGMTGKQIRKMVRKEGVLLCLMGAPAGLFLGSLFAWFIIPEGWSWNHMILCNMIIWIADLITVLISIQKPAKIAALVSPMEAVRATGYEAGGKENTKGLHRKLTPFHLAKMSNVRNWKKTILTMISLGVGGILFSVAATFVASVNLQEYSRQGEYKFGEFDLELSDNAVATSKHGMTGVQMSNPFDEELLEKITSVDGVKEIKKAECLKVKYQYNNYSAEDRVSPFTREEVQGLQKGLAEGNFDYDEMIKKDQVLISLNDQAEEIFGWRFETGSTVKLSWFDGKETKEKEFTIAGAVNNYNEENYWTIYNSSWFLMPEEMVQEMNPEKINLTCTVVVSTDFKEKGAQIEKELETIMQEEPLITMNTLTERIEMDKSSFNLMFKILIGLAVFIIAFSLINLINTLISGIVERKREMAMLQSVGMERKQITRMIQYEGILLAAGNMAITLTIGTACGYGMVQVLRKIGADYMHYHFPGLMLAVYAVVILAVPMIVSETVLHLLQKKTLVERLREIG